MATWSKTQGVCATCRFWLGKREVDFTAQNYRVYDRWGKCSNPKGGFRQMKMNEGQRVGIGKRLMGSVRFV